jgi:hypothetical protein
VRYAALVRPKRVGRTWQNAVTPPATLAEVATSFSCKKLLVRGSRAEHPDRQART